MNRTVTTTLVTVYLASILAANYAITHIGTPIPNGPHVLPVGFGLTAPSGVYVVGLTLVLRDRVQHRIGVAWTFALIALGAGLTATFAPSLAFASAVAFVAAESIDLGIYTLVSKWSDLGGVLASNAVSIVVDSLVFLSMAFGSLAFIEGQVVGKAWATLAGFAVLVALQTRRQVTA